MAKANEDLKQSYDDMQQKARTRQMDLRTKLIVKNLKQKARIELARGKVVAGKMVAFDDEYGQLQIEDEEGHMNIISIRYITSMKIMKYDGHE